MCAYPSFEVLVLKQTSRKYYGRVILGVIVIPVKVLCVAKLRGVR
jgi:hypothetical protein